VPHFQRSQIYESLALTTWGLMAAVGDESIAEVEDNEECPIGRPHIHPGLITKIRALFSTRVPPPHCSTISWSFITRIINLPFRSAAVNSIYPENRRRYSQWIRDWSNWEKPLGPFRQQNLIVVLEDTHCYKQGLPIGLPIYRIGWRH